MLHSSNFCLTRINKKAIFAKEKSEEGSSMLTMLEFFFVI